MTTTMTLNARLDAGIEWLDETRPDWRSRVDPTQLDMTDATWCVLGQVFHDRTLASGAPVVRTGYRYALEHYSGASAFSQEANAWACRLGFQCADEDDLLDLSDAWRAKLDGEEVS